MLIGFIGIAIASLTLPFTRIAVLELDPLFVAFGRATLAGICACLTLLVIRSPAPTCIQLVRLIVVAVGIIYGFPIFSAIAMTSLPSAHSGIVLGILPLATSMFGVFRFKEKPSYHFWLASAFGSLLVLTYSFIDGAGALQADDVWLLFGIFFAALGYSEGGKLAEQMGAITVISWALALTLPLNAIITFYLFSPSYAETSLNVWIAFSYVGVFSMFIAFFFVYRGIALGGGRARRTSTTITAFSYSTRGLFASGRTVDLAQQRLCGSCTYYRCPRRGNQNTATTWLDNCLSGLRIASQNKLL